MLATSAPFPQYFDTDGKSLESGSIYFGVAGQNPETNPITVYWDVAGTQPAAQPIRTSGGYTVRSGTPAVVYAAGDYSITVRNGKGEMVYYAASSASFSNDTALAQLRTDLASTASAAVGTGLVGWLRAAASAVATTLYRWLSWQDVNVFEFMSLAQIADVQAGTLAVDVTAACQAALNTGQPVKFPRGKYKLTAELVPVSGGYGVQLIYGVGQDATQLFQYAAGAKCISQSGVPMSVRTLSCYSGAVSTATGLDIIGANPTYVTDVKVAGFKTNVKVNSTSRKTYLTRLDCINALQDNVEVEAAVDTYIYNLYSGGASNAGGTGCNLVLSGACSGVHVFGAELTLGDHNFKTRFLQPANVAGIPSQVFLHDVTSDSAVKHGNYHEQGNTIVYHGGWTSNRGTGKNFYMGPAVNDLQLNGHKGYNCTGHILEIQGPRFSLHGGSFQDAGFGAPNTYDAIFVTGASAVGAQINGPRCYSDGNTTRYGVRFTAGANNGVTSGSILSGNVTGGYFDDAGAGTNNRMLDPQTGVTGPIANTATATLFALPAGPGTYVATAAQQGAPNGGIRAQAQVQVGTTTLAVSSVVSAGGIALSATGADLNVQLTNNAGGPLTVTWSYRAL